LRLLPLAGQNRYKEGFWGIKVRAKYHLRNQPLRLPFKKIPNALPGLMYPAEKSIETLWAFSKSWRFNKVYEVTGRWSK